MREGTRIIPQTLKRREHPGTGTEVVDLPPATFVTFITENDNGVPVTMVLFKRDDGTFDSCSPTWMRLAPLEVE